jgi:hypothetical protein
VFGIGVQAWLDDNQDVLARDNIDVDSFFWGDGFSFFLNNQGKIFIKVVCH